MRRWLLLIGVLACGCADRSLDGYGVDDDAQAETDDGDDGATADDGGSADAGDGDGDAGDDGEDGDPTGEPSEPGEPDEPGPDLDGLPSVCTEAPSGPMHAAYVGQYQELLAGFAVSSIGAAAVTSLEGYDWVLTVVCPDGTVAWRVDLPVHNSQPFVGGVAFGPDGDVWVSGANFVDGSFERMIARYTPDGERAGSSSSRAPPTRRSRWCSTRCCR